LKRVLPLGKKITTLIKVSCLKKGDQPCGMCKTDPEGDFMGLNLFEAIKCCFADLHVNNTNPNDVNLFNNDINDLFSFCEELGMSGRSIISR